MKANLNYKSKRTIIITAIIIALLAVAAVGTYVFTKGNDRAQAFTEENVELAETTIENTEQPQTGSTENNAKEQTLTPNTNNGESITGNSTTTGSNANNNTSTTTTNNNNNTANIAPREVVDTVIETVETGTDGKYLSWKETKPNILKVAQNLEVNELPMIAYTVKHMIENENDDGYTEVRGDRTIMYGRAGEMTKATRRHWNDFGPTPYYENYSWYYANQAPVEQKKIEVDGSTVVEIYYDFAKFILHYDANGGTGNMDDLVHKIINQNFDVTLDSNGYIKEGYKFTYWNSKLDGTGTNYNPRGRYKLYYGIPANGIAEQTLYAQWQEVHAIFDSNKLRDTLKSFNYCNTIKRSYSEPPAYGISEVQSKYSLTKNGKTYSSNVPIKMWNEDGILYWYTLDPHPDLQNASSLFSNMTNLIEEDITSESDMSTCTNMSSMYSQCRSLEKINAKNWNTSNVNRMDSMFNGCKKLTTLDLSNIDTSSVTNMNAMFKGCEGLTTLDLDHLNTSNVKDMSEMFYNCSNLTEISIANWDTSNVTTMQNMFRECHNLKQMNVENWKLGNVTTMQYMFYNCKSLEEINLHNWELGKVTTMQYMFYNCKSLKKADLNNWDVGSVINMQNMFERCEELTSVNIDKWDVSNVKDMSWMFSECKNLELVYFPNWNTNSLNKTYMMFYICTKLTEVDISNWETQNLTSTSSMFKACSKLPTLDLSGWETTNLSNASDMFCYCRELRTIYVSEKFTADKIPSSQAMFTDCSKLRGGNGTTFWRNLNTAKYARIDAPGTPGYFTAKTTTSGTNSAPNMQPLSLSPRTNSVMAPVALSSNNAIGVTINNDTIIDDNNEIETENNTIVDEEIKEEVIENETTIEEVVEETSTPIEEDGDTLDENVVEEETTNTVEEN